VLGADAGYRNPALRPWDRNAAGLQPLAAAVGDVPQVHLFELVTRFQGRD
jgi:hypothetical protein